MKNLQVKYIKCSFCQNYYGPCYGEPLCLTCHNFVFPNSIVQDIDFDISLTSACNALVDLKTKSSSVYVDDLFNSGNFGSLTNYNEFGLKLPRNIVEKLESNDSGNEDPDENNTILKIGQSLKISNLETDILNNNKNDNLYFDKNFDQFKIEENPKSPLIDQLPNEVLLSIFFNLDDLSLWSVSQVCKKWHELIKQEISEEKWKTFINERWIFFKSSIKVESYLELYSQLVQSTNCFYCLQQIHNRVNNLMPQLVMGEELKRSWRHKRLLLELRSLQQDPPDGINARPLDSSCYYWQASITGPVGSPYEGGVFYLYLKIPQSYPLNPPLVRFITKIYHPNISRHGDIGLDSIHENWSLALTISKVLISIQSLLTDPYTHVCMEQEIGQLYRQNRDLYESNAKIYTWKYAISDFANFSNQVNLDEYFEQINFNNVNNL